MNYEEAKNSYLAGLGVTDPENYDVLPDDRVVRRAAPPEPPPQPSTWSDTWRSAVYNTPRNVLGFMGGAGGVAGGAAVGLPSVIGAVPSAVAGGIAGGMAGSMAGEAIQNKLYPQSWIDAEMERRARSPLATYLGGDVAPSLALMRPSLPVLKTAGRALLDTRGFTDTFRGLRGGPQAALANVLIGGGLQGGMEGGRQLATGEFDPVRLATETGIGLVSTEPTKLGQVLSGRTFKPTNLGVDWVGDLKRSATSKRAIPAPPPPEPAPLPPENPLATMQFGVKPPKRRGGGIKDIVEAPGMKLQPDAEPAPRRSPYDIPGATEASMKEFGDATLPEEYRNVFRDFAKAEYGIDVQTPETVPGSETALGQMNVRPAQDAPAEMFLNRSKAVRETPVHELVHDYDNSVMKYGDERTKAQWAAMKKSVGEEYARDNKDAILRQYEEFKVEDPGTAKERLRQWILDEGIAQRIGPKFVEFLGGKEPGFFRKWGNARAVRRGRATAEQAVEYGANRLLRGRGTQGVETKVDWKSPYVKPGAVTGESEAKKQEEIWDNLPDDEGQKYNRWRGWLAVNLDNVDRYLNRLTPNTEEANAIKQELLDWRGDALPGQKELIASTDFTNREAVAALKKRFYGAAEKPKMQDEVNPNIMVPESVKELSKPKPFGLPVSPDGTMSTAEVLAALRNKISPTENEMIYEPVAKKFAGTARVRVDEVRAAIEEVSPGLEVVKLEADKDANTPDFVKEHARLTHHYDTLGKFPSHVFDGRPHGEASSISYYDTRRNRDLSPIEVDPESEEFKTAQRFEELGKQKSTYFDTENDSATRKYDFVNPRALKDMPGAVDLLVRIPRQKRDTTARAVHEKMNPGFGGAAYDELVGVDRNVNLTDPPIYPASSSHYPKSGDNALVHVRAYEHTMPDGERVLRVFELQSDWAQQRRKAEGDRSKYTIIPDEQTPEQIARTGQTFTSEGPNGLRAGGFGSEKEAAAWIDNRINEITPNHPLLKHAQRLGIKAAIDHARKIGVKRIVIDDAETAMLTEQHDQRVNVAHTDPMVFDTKEAADAEMANWGEDAKDFIVVPVGKKWHMRAKLDQEVGMRLAYDKTLQKMAAEMSGTEGVKVEMGTHRNAINTRSERVPGTNTEEADSMIDTSDWRTIEEPRPDLIFKNPDGTPKTTSTGTAYDMSAPIARREKGEPFTTTRPKFQEPVKGDVKYGPDALKSSDPDEPFYKKFVGLFAGATETLGRRGTAHRYLSDKLNQTFATKRNMAARYFAPIVDAMPRWSTKEDAQALIDVLYRESLDGKSYRDQLDSDLWQAYDATREALARSRDEQLAAKQRNVEGEMPGKDPFYFPHVISRDVMRILKTGLNNNRYNEIKKRFIEFNTELGVEKGMPEAQAKQRAESAFGKYQASLKVRNVEDAFDFGAVQLPAGTKLPPEMIEPDFADSMRRYFNRFARDRVFYDKIRRDEKASAAVGLETYFDKDGVEVPIDPEIAKEYETVSTAPEVQKILAGYAGISESSSDKLTPAIGRLVNALILAGPSTRAADILTTPFKAVAFVSPTQIPGLIKAATLDVPEGLRSGGKTGMVNKGDMVFARTVLGAGEEVASRLDKLTEGVAKFTGTEQLERWSRGVAQSIGEYIAKIKLAEANAGSAKAEEFLNKLGTDWREVDVNELGTRIGQLFQGKYDVTNLPTWAYDSPIAPFLSMMRWNIEQWNNFKKFVWEPAKKGDVYPLLAHFAGALAGGLTIEEAREIMMQKKSENATLKEIAAAKDDPAALEELMLKYASVMQATGVMGIVSELGSQALDGLSGRLPQGFRYPMVEVVGDTAARSASAVEALRDGEDPAKVGWQWLKDIGTQHVQMGRFIYRAAGAFGYEEAAREMEDMNARRDVRKFVKLSGLPKAESPVKFSPYRKLSEKEFDKAESVGEAKKLLPYLKQRAVERAGGNKERLAEEMRGIRTIGGRIGPSPSANPKRFRDYIEFIRQTKGPEAAEKARVEALKEDKLRKAKARIVR